MSSSLFRKEALEHRKDRLFGDVILLQPLSITLLVGVVAVICALIIAMLFWGTYARKETVRGYLVPDKGIVKTYTPQPGTISKVHLREGDDVIVGQPLITILSERAMQGGSDIDTLLLKEIETTKQHQLEHIQAEESLLVSDTERLKGQIQSLQNELAQTESSLKTQEARLNILAKREKGAKTLLDSKNMSENEYQKYLDELLVQRQHYQDMLNAKGNAQNKLAQASSELDQLPIRSKSRINEVQNKISELNQRYAEIEGRKTVEIRSPIPGTVTALQAREGLAASSNTPLLAIIPKDATLQVELFLPSRAIGFISEGQTVRIRFEAFPYQRFGIYEGNVKIISKHAMLPSELPVPMELNEPVYRITADLSQQSIQAYGKDFPLQAGMLLEADIILDNQTLFEWVLNPLISLKGRF